MRLVWVDQYGRVVRTKRVQDRLDVYSIQLSGGRLSDCPWWTSAKVSDLYNALPDEDMEILNAKLKQPL